MITEDYVSFETAKLLKEKGFDEATFYDYNERGTRWFEEVLVNHNSQGGVACPTLQMAMKWLRETHKISVEPLPDWLDSNHTDIHDGWYCEIRNLTDMSYDADYFEHKKYSTYEEACEAAIKHCLENLI